MSVEEIKTNSGYPISEIFTSWQGEGLWAGTPMTFIRFAGCNVGKSIIDISDTDGDGHGPGIHTGLKPTENYGIIPIWQEECTSWDGRKFLCDTDFRVKERLTVDEIFARVPDNIEHICLTGGEPLVRDIYNILDLANHRALFVHIETSGTKPIGAGDRLYDRAWVTVSPKDNCLRFMLHRANELKLLVDKDFDIEKAKELVKDKSERCIVWLSPINGIDTIDKENMKLCQSISEQTGWRLTNQNHKLWGCR